MRKEQAAELARSSERILQAFHTITNEIIVIRGSLEKVIEILIKSMEIDE